jgi:hypothetical protein
MKKIVLVAGATGNLGKRIASFLLQNGAEVRILVRNQSDGAAVAALEQSGALVFKVHNWDVEEIARACKDVSCVVSALAGLRDVVIDAQKILLEGAILAGVPRFIPSDYSLDFTKFSEGENRNLDWRREFHRYLDKRPIKATSIFNSAFMDMLTGQMPVILFKQRIVIFWGNADSEWDFTTINNTAEYTALVALDDSSPRFLRIAGERLSPVKIRNITEEVYGVKFRLFRPGGQKLLGLLIKWIRKLSKGENELYPAWQGMQYMHNMIDERSKNSDLDNKRYPKVIWTMVKEILQTHKENVGMKQL